MTLEVIIPAYNARKTIGRTLSSLAAQLNKNFSVTVADDCSTDSTATVVERFVGVLNIRVLKTPVNSGPGPARQLGLDRSTADFVTFLDSDDMFMPYTTDAFLGIINRRGTSLELLTSPFYADVKDESGCGLALVNHAMTWLHGKVYQRQKLLDYDIRFDEKYPINGEDCYFNSLAISLLHTDQLNLPTVLWVQRDGSITHSEAFRRFDTMRMFINAMYDSSMHILRYRDTVDHLKYSLDRLDKSAVPEDLMDKYEKLIDISKR